MRAAIPLLVVLFTAPAGCGDGRGADIEYSSNDKPFGKWPGQLPPSKTGKANAGGDASESSETSSTPSPSNLEMGRADAGSNSESDSGMDSDTAKDEPAKVETPGTSKPTTPAIKDAGGASPRLACSVLTEVQHMRLAKSDPAFDDDARGPENMGAIWISKPDGTFVRSLEVWRLNKERARHLLAYNKACQCPKPDVIATATLNKHREHMVSWDLSSREGAQVPAGSYTLHIEVADYDVDKPDKLDTNASNAQWSFDFDTHEAPKTVMPEAAPFYTNLKVELLKP